MQVTVTLTFDSEAAASAYLASKSPEKDAAKTPKPAKTETPAASQPSAGETKATPPADAPAKTPAADPVADYLKSGLPELIQKGVAKDRAAVIALLAEFKVKKGAELKPEQFADFKLRVEALLAPADDLS